MKRTAPLSRIFLVVLAAAMAVVPVAAFQVTTTAPRFEGKVIQDPSTSLNSAPVPAKELKAGTALRSAWDLFTSQYGDGWDITVDSRSGVPLLVQGQGIPWIAGSGNTLSEAASPTVDSLSESIQTFVRDHAILFETNVDEMVLNRAGSGQMNKDLWAITYQRQVGGVPVSGDTYVFYIGHGNLITFGANRWGAISASPVPSIPATEAFMHLTNYMGLSDSDHLTVIDAGSLQFTPLAATGSDNQTYSGPVGSGYDVALTYRISFRIGDEAPTWVALVDANTGRVRALYDDNDYAQVKGGVLPLSNDGQCPSGCEQPNYPMPFADVTINGGAAPAANGAGIFNCTPLGGTAVTTLSGPFIKVVDTCGAVSGSSICGNDIDLGINAGTDCAIPAGAAAGDTRSSRTGFFHLNRIKEVARAFLPGNVWLNAQLTDNVNINLTCNAFWNGSTVNFYRSGGGCRNTGEISAVFLHEWGHGLDSNDGGGASNPGEAQADITSFLVTHASCIGRGFFANDDPGCGGGYGNACLACSGIRDQDWDKRTNHTPSTPEGFIATCSGGGGPCGKEVHCEGYLVGETLWDLATRDLPAAGLDTNSAWQLANKLWYVSRQGSGGNMYGCGAPADQRSCAATTVMQQLRVTDDDDGNLANGTPHAAAIFSAFSRHNIPCGFVGDAQNQNTSSCPALSAPTVTTTAGSGAITLNWNAIAGAASYKVLRNDASCGSGYQIIATVAAPTITYTDNGLANGFTEYYSVQAVGSNAACDGPMAACVTGTPQPCAGAVTVSKQIYNCADNVGIQLVDSDLVGAGTYNVAVTSTSEASPETVTLTETPPTSGIFVGNILTTTAPASSDGLITVANGDTIDVRYVDVSYCGTPNVNVDATATVDCLGPVITNVQSSNVTGNSARITWDTNEPSNSSVTYGVAPGPPGTTTPVAPLLVTSHSMVVSGLAPCTPYVFSVSSTDTAGNSAFNDNGGTYYTFTTGVNVQPTYPYGGPPVNIPDNTTVNATITVPDNKTIVDLNVTIDSLTHSYDGDMVISLVPPVGPPIVLSNRRGGSGDNFTNTVFDDSAATAISAGTAPFTGPFRPDAPLSALNGTIAMGTWTLRVQDAASLDTGVLTSWSLNFTYPSQQCGPSIGFESATKVESCIAGGPGNGNGYIDPGEDVVIPVTARANGTSAVTGVSAILSSSQPGVTVTRNYATFPDMAADATAQSNPDHFAISLDDSFPCGSMINLNIQFTANEGSWGSSFSIGPTGTPGSGTNTYNSTDVPKTIPDNTTINSIVNVVNPGTVSDVDVGVNITHTYDGDMVLSLVPPVGAPIILSNRRGGSGDNFVNTVFDDSAITPISSGVAPFTGPFRPDNALAGANGIPANGTWTMRVQDAASLDTGTLTAWFVRITATTAPTCANCTPAGPGEAGIGPLLRWQAPNSKTVIEWGSAIDSSYYKVYQGTGASLPGLIDATVDSCLKGTTTSLSMSGLSSSPPTGTTWWYLVTGNNGSSEGPAGTGSYGPEVVNSSGGCP